MPKFDVVVMNPPYYQGVNNKFLRLCFQQSKRYIVSVHSYAWLLSLKKDKEIIEHIKNTGLKIKTINANKYFDAFFSNKIGIHYIDLESKDNSIYIDDDKYDDITKLKSYSDKPCFVEFASKLDLSDVLFSHLKKSDKEQSFGKYICKVPKIRGHVYKDKDTRKQDDFYTIISNNEKFINEKVKGLYDDLNEIPNAKNNTVFFYYAFDTLEETENFIKYIKTDFVRACVYLIKTEIGIKPSFKGISWQDFTNNSDIPWNKSIYEISNYLYKKYGISDEIKYEIEKYLPDYYSIRN